MRLPTRRLDWPQEWLELYQERAGIMAVLGHMPIWKAEKEAEQDIRRVAEREGC